MAEFENAVTKMNEKGESSTTVNGIVINKEKGEWKKPDTTATYDASNTTASNHTG